MNHDVELVDPYVGAVVDGCYLLCGEISRDERSALFVAEHYQLGSRSVLKCLHGRALADPHHHAGLEREARALSRVRHPHAITALDAGTCPRHGPYFTKTRPPGAPLDRVLAEGTLDIARFTRILAQVGSVVSHLETVGVVHGDIRASNVLVGWSDGGEENATLIGFGKGYTVTPGESVDGIDGEMLGIMAYESIVAIAGHAPARANSHGSSYIPFRTASGAR
jgi:serine/threonine-protein kinase